MFLPDGWKYTFFPRNTQHALSHIIRYVRSISKTSTLRQQFFVLFLPGRNQVLVSKFFKNKIPQKISGDNVDDRSGRLILNNSFSGNGSLYMNSELSAELHRRFIGFKLFTLDFRTIIGPLDYRKKIDSGQSLQHMRDRKM